MFLLSFRLLTITFPAFSPYFQRFLLHISCIFTIYYTIFIASLFSSFPAFDAVFQHFLIFLPSFLSLPSHFLHFHNILYDFCCLTFLYISCVLRYFLHFPMLLLSDFLCFPSHFYDFFASLFSSCPAFYVIFLHFPMFLLSFPLLTITFLLHISCIFTVSSTIFVASLSSLFPAFYVIFLHFPCF